MAITQARMIRLIRTADLFKNQILSAQHFVASECKTIPPTATRDELLTAIQTIQLYFAQISFPPADLDNLAAERTHFANNATRNARQAGKVRERRGTSLEAGSITAPTSMDKSKTKNWADLLNPAPAEHGRAGLLIANLAKTPETEKTLSQHKLDYNAISKRFNMPVPYEDPYNDEEPLLPEHAGPTAGLTTGEDDSLF